MICIEEWGHEPECAAPVESAALDPVSTGSFAFRLRFGAPFARENGVGGVGRRLDVAVTQIAAADADLERNNRIYFTRSRGFLLSSVREKERQLATRTMCMRLTRQRTAKREGKPGQDTLKKFAISHLLRVHWDATDRGRSAFRATHAALAHLKYKRAFSQTIVRQGHVTFVASSFCIGLLIRSFSFSSRCNGGCFLFSI